MSVHFISGKPGGGKTLYALRMIVWELVHGIRPILTNVPINLGALAEYLQKQYPHHTINISERVYLFSEDEAKEFFCHRWGSKPIKRVSKEEWKNGERPDYSTVKDGGIMYVLDEAHLYYNARDFADTGRDALFYLSQHRKLGDTVVFVTQSVLNVDVALRRVAQDYTYLKNLAKQREGWFRLPSLFLRRTYAFPLGPDGVENQECLESGSFRLDVKGLAACYNTAAGVSIHGKMADTNEKKKGIDWRLGLGVLVAVILIIAFGAPRALGSLLSVKPKILPPQRIAPMGQPQQQQTTNTTKLVAEPDIKTRTAVRPGGSATSTNWIVGRVAYPYWRVILADGQVLTRAELSVWGDNYVVDKEGHKFRYH